MGLKLSKLDKTMPIVEFKFKDPSSGKWVMVQGISTTQFQIFWQSISVKADTTGSGLTDKVDTVTIDPSDPDALTQICLALRNAL